MKREIIRAAIIALGIFAAAIVAVIAASLLFGSGGRDIVAPGATLAAILLLSSASTRSILHWPIQTMIGGLLLAEVAMLLLVGHFSGATGANLFDPFNLVWLAGLNLFVGVPWLIGTALGSVIALARTQSFR